LACREVPTINPNKKQNQKQNGKPGADRQNTKNPYGKQAEIRRTEDPPYA